MADGKIILRPASTAVLEKHIGYPENTSLYRWISEEICDGDVGYIYAEAPEGNKDAAKTNTAQTLVYFKYVIPNKKVTFDNIYLRFCARSENSVENSSKIKFKANGPGLSEIGSSETPYQSLTDEYPAEPDTVLIDGDYTKKLSNYLSKESAGSTVNIVFLVTTVNGYSSETNKGSVETITQYTYTEVRLSQLYLEIDYNEILDIGVHKKVNGEYKAANAAYRKIGGSWVEITEDECKSILKSNTIIKGG